MEQNSDSKANNLFKLHVVLGAACIIASGVYLVAGNTDAMIYLGILAIINVLGAILAKIE